MRSSSDLSLLSLGQPNQTKKIPTFDKAADSRGFHNVMREANESAQARQKPVKNTDTQAEIAERSSRPEKVASNRVENQRNQEQNDDAHSAVIQDKSQKRQGANEQSSEKNGSEKNNLAKENTAEEHKSAKEGKASESPATSETQTVAQDNEAHSSHSPKNLNDAESKDSAELTAFAATNLEKGVVADQQNTASNADDGKALQVKRPDGAVLGALNGALNIDALATKEGEASELALLDPSAIEQANKQVEQLLKPDVMTSEVLVEGESLTLEESEALAALLMKGSESSDGKVQGASSTELSELNKELAGKTASLEETVKNQMAPVSVGNESEGSDLSAQLASAALNLSDTVNAKTTKKVDALGQGSIELNSTDKPVLLADDLASGQDSLEGNAAELDWVLQQMSATDASEYKVGLKPELAASKITPSMAGLVTQNGDMKNSNLQPLELANATISNAGSEMLEASLLDGESLALDSDALIKDQPLSRTTTNEAALGGLSSAGQAAATKVAQLGMPAGISNPSVSANLTMQVPPTHPNWGSEMGDKLMWMTQQGVHKAEIHLDPPELGSLTVKVSVDADTATVSFVVASSQVKDLLDGQVQRLREMLAQQNINLDSVDVDVSRQGAGSNNNGTTDNAQRQVANSELENDEMLADEMDVAANIGHVSASRVDFYA